MKTILFFRTAFHPHHRFKSKALLDFADRHDWKIQIAAELLDQAMSGKATPVKSRNFGVKRIVRRASANGTRNIDKRVTAAIEFVRKNFCRRITPRDVAKQMGCSMRHAHRIFLDARRHSILDEIHLRRIELAKEQLRARVVSIESIAEQCGYASSTDFGRVFKRYTSLTPRDWRYKE